MTHFCVLFVHGPRLGGGVLGFGDRLVEDVLPREPALAVGRVAEHLLPAHLVLDDVEAERGASARREQRLDGARERGLVQHVVVGYGGTPPSFLKRHYASCGGPHAHASLNLEAYGGGGEGGGG